jgi:hypothetical protein
MKKLAKFVSLSAAEEFLLLRTVIIVAAIRVGLSILPFRVVQRFAFKAPKIPSSNSFGRYGQRAATYPAQHA